MSLVFNTDTASKATGGRPKGSNIMTKHHLKEVLIATKNEVAVIYLEEKEKYKKEGGKLPNHLLNNKIAKVSSKRGMPNTMSINAATVKNYKGANVLQVDEAKMSMVSVEPHLVELICTISDIGDA